MSASVTHFEIYAEEPAELEKFYRNFLFREPLFNQWFANIPPISWHP